MLRHLLVLLVLGGLSSGLIQAADSVCQTKTACSNLDTRCQCYCSRICKFRDKEVDDHPIYQPDDLDGKYCYCKPEDLQEFRPVCKSRE